MSSVKIAAKPDLREQMFEVGRAARAAPEAAAKELRASAKTVLRANADDVAEAKGAGLSSAMIDRLALNEKRIEATAAGLEVVAALEDPVGQTIASWERPNGLKISRV